MVSARLALLLALGFSCGPNPLLHAEIHVAPGGDDAGAGSAQSPVRTMTEALRRTRVAGAEKRIVLAGGRHELPATLELGVADSGLLVEAAPGARPTLSGGVRLTGWEKDPAVAGLWKTRVPEVPGGWVFHQLFLDGRRLTRARIPNEGFFRLRAPLGAASPITLPFRPGDLKSAWAGNRDARLVMLMKWTDLHVPIQSVDEAKNEAVIPGGPKPEWMTEGDARYWVENVPEALDREGEWTLDSRAGVVSLLAPRGVDPNQATVVAPRWVTLLRVKGDEGARRPVEKVVFRGVTLAESDYEMPAEGIISPQAAVPVRGAVRVEFATDGAFEQCTFENLGGYAVDLGRGARRWKISECSIREAGGGGVRVGEPGDRDPDAFTACDAHQITDSRLVGLGRIFAPAVGVILFQTGHNRIAHNEIADLYYTAVSVGWNWGYQDTPCRGNVIEFNHMHHIGQGRLSDMGGVYTLGPQPGTVVRNNLIHDVVSYDYGGWGLYTDEGSTGILLESNVVYGCKSSGFHQHYGRENVVRNNVFAFNTEHQLMRTRDEEHLSFYFTNNVVCFDSGQLLGSSWKNDRFVIDRNLYFDTRLKDDPAGLKFSGATWEAWRARGHDTHSVIADPMFRDAAKRDLRLRDGSPALALGFRPIQLDDVGPRKK
ncbi:MAG: right-handed parallel beta-helix repeat-containing protein [Verrucomicrobiales bacterium]|nr:right-handed parallel beta-helix repeat-containing protein [Verrucomicrobiales bacterium]